VLAGLVCEDSPPAVKGTIIERVPETRDDEEPDDGVAIEIPQEQAPYEERGNPMTTRVTDHSRVGLL
jgi:hypothetical protein